MKPPPAPGEPIQPPWNRKLVASTSPEDKERMLARAKIVKNSKRAQLMLESLGFDPIRKLVNQYERLEKDILDYERLRRDGPDLDADGRILRKFSGMAYVSLLTVQQRLLTELLPYGYAKQLNTDDTNDGKSIPRMQIILTPKGGDAAVIAEQKYNDSGFSGNTYSGDDNG